MKTKLSLALRVFSIAIQLIYVKSYTHYLTVAELGYSFYLTALSYSINALLLVPADFYLQAALAQYYEQPFPLGQYVSVNAKLLGVAFLVAALVGAPICLAHKLDFVGLVQIFLLAVFFYLSASVRNFLNNRGHALYTGWMLLLESVLKVASFLLLLKFGSSRVSAFMLSTVSAYLVETVFLSVFFVWKVPFRWRMPSNLSFRSMARASSVITFTAVCNWLQLQGYRIVYVWLGFAETAGLYTAVANLGSMGMNASSTVFSQMLLPRLYTSRGRYIFKYVQLAALLCVAVAAGYLVFGRVLLMVLTKSSFGPYAKLMLFGVVVEGCNLLIGAASAYFTIRRTPRRLLPAALAGVVSAGVATAACLAWLPHSHLALGETLAASQLLVCGVLYFEMRLDAEQEAINA